MLCCVVIKRVTYGKYRKSLINLTLHIHTPADQTTFLDLLWLLSPCYTRIFHTLIIIIISSSSSCNWDLYASYRCITLIAPDQGHSVSPKGLTHRVHPMDCNRLEEDALNSSRKLTNKGIVYSDDLCWTINLFYYAWKIFQLLPHSWGHDCTL